MVHAVQCGNLYSHKRLFLHNVIKSNAMSYGNLTVAKERRQLYCFLRVSSNVLAEPAIQVYKNLDPAVLDVDLQQQTAIVSYRQTKRESADSIVLSYDMKNHRIIWKENIGVVNAEQKNPGVRTLENYYAIQAGDEFLLLNKDTKKEMFRYQLRWNRPIQ
ncbi:hypothetical protein [Lysinibacillus sp. NPDC086135]|uniref:hypothetical protein n=1 Tax=Lysinibacillus sp. NPDC086135 TaxID=3364130 RepID=UPI00381BEFD2